ncbi:PAS domain S-box-containing protein/diguanylate cyclase (GGDEF)-like protein [Cryobacterium sp. CAN_C3]|uniref:EAL domain-containing protein n=1 Tax=unclassified Cryobacterium TaxID=2649013 RepID=UPI0018CA9900|nr:EAL domain-containing protein [Cryobacterium sp. CAN_C3]MEC5156027.1 PAS domain S-box-containing protein/diguanylate cyclase (GGDEF)-like protein [Cryobacterium sp. CAN_C3]
MNRIVEATFSGWVESQPTEGASAALLARAFAATSRVSLITDAQQNILHASAAFTAITGYSEAEVLGTNCRLLQGPGSRPEDKDAIRRAIAAGEAYDGDILNYRKDGSPFWNRLTIVPLRGPDEIITHFVSVQQDASTRVGQQEQLRYQATHDAVTGIPNRFEFETHLRRRSEAAASNANAASTRQAGLGLIDFNDLRRVASTFGYSAADTVLAEFSRRLSDLLGDGDYLAFLGGKTFAVVLDNLGDDASPEFAGRLADIHEAVETPFVVDGESVFLWITMGIARLPASGSEAGTRQLADRALQLVKATSDNAESWWRLVSDIGPESADAPQAATATIPRVPAGRHSERARSNQDQLFAGELSMYMQPIIDLRNGAVRRVEALARLILPDGTIVPPERFLAGLNDEDLDELFRTGLKDALGWIARWDAEGLAVDVSVNLAPSTLQHLDFIRWVTEALSHSGVAPHRLCLELLETQELDEAAPLLVFDALIELGVGLALDDLGSGYSSLQRIAQLPFDTIKVDRGLLADVAMKPIETLSLIATLAQMGRDMRAAVVVEGLEDAGLVEAASVLGASLGQGYYFARPMPAAELPTWAHTFRLPEEFHLPERAGQLHTNLGALAYHWQFTRWESPHPFDLDTCPVTKFIIDRTAPGSDPRLWHERQHEVLASHNRASNLLLNWLTDANTTR